MALTGKRFQPYSPKKIRKRYSYEEWEKLIDSYIKNDMGKFFSDLHFLLDTKKAFPYARTGVWSRESLNQVLKDKGFPYDEEFFTWIKKHRRSNNGF